MGLHLAFPFLEKDSIFFVVFSNDDLTTVTLLPICLACQRAPQPRPPGSTTAVGHPLASPNMSIQKNSPGCTIATTYQSDKVALGLHISFWNSYRWVINGCSWKYIKENVMKAAYKTSANTPGHCQQEGPITLIFQNQCWVCDIPTTQAALFGREAMLSVLETRSFTLNSTGDSVEIINPCWLLC